MRHSFPFDAFLLCIVIFLFPVIAPPATLAQKIALAGVPNAGKMNDFLLRGAQPSYQGLAELNSRFEILNMPALFAPVS
jgi:hypothetical protein